MDREFLENLRVGEEGLPEAVIAAILDQQDRDAQAHAQQLQQLRLEGCLRSAVAKAGGRSEKAIAALLDMEAIAQSEDMAGAMDAAVKALKDRESYLFAAPQAPPYAAGTGTHTPEDGRPASLAEALRARAAGNG